MLIVILIYIMLLAIVCGLGYWSYVIGRWEWSDAAGDVIPVTYFFVGLLLAGMIQGSMQETVTLIVGGSLLGAINFGLLLWGRHRTSEIRSYEKYTKEYERELQCQGYRVMDSFEATIVIGRFFSALRPELSRKALKSFTNKEGFAAEYIFIGFKSDLEDVPDDERLQKLDDEHVLVEQDSAIAFSSEDVDEIAYLDFATFYETVVDEVNELARENPSDGDMLDLLADFKKGLHEKTS